MVWHRRSGKDKSLLNLVHKKAWERVGVYFYLFPTYAQGKKILWHGIDRNGMKFLDHIPKEVRKRTDNGEMLIELKNGSIIQVIGTDKIDSIVGTNPVGCVFSEYSLQNPSAWNYIRPILAENDGWAVFNYTPRGRNHGWQLYEMAKNDNDWFCQLLTVDDTRVIPKDVLEKEKIEMAKQTGDDSLFYQEYYCSFDVAIQGSYYGKMMKEAEEQNRITSIPYDPRLPVDTWWDLGVGDATAIWFSQSIGSEIRFIDYYEAQGEGFPFYAKALQDKGYVYRTHNGPHDLAVREIGTGVSRIETAKSLGINFNTVPNIGIDDGINAVRLILGRCYFDRKKCEQGINALVSYHKEYDEDRKQYKNKPEHDWSSHGADAFRYFAVQHDKVNRPKPSQYIPHNPHIIKRR